jgi:hypothetical protein
MEAVSDPRADDRAVHGDSSEGLSTPPVSGLEQRWPSPVRLAVWLVAVLVVAGGTAFEPLVGVAVTAGVAGSLFLLHRPVTAALLVVAVAPAVSGIARGLPVPGARLSEVLIAGTAVLVLLLTRIDEPPWRATDWMMLLFAVGTLALGTAGALRHGIPFDGQSISDLLLPFQFVLITRAVTTALNRPEDRRRALRWALRTGAAVSLLAIAQRFLPPVQDVVVRLTGSDNYAFNTLYFVPRATGPFTIWHYLGGYLLIIALLAIALLMTGDTTVLRRPDLGLVLLLATVGIVLTLTLAVLLGLVLGYIVLALWSGRGRLWLFRGLAVGVAAGILASPLIGGRLADQRGRGDDSLVPQTLSFRWDIWTEQYFPSMSGRWITGYGPAIPDEITWRYTESVYITYLLQGGLVLVVLFLGLQAVILRQMRDLKHDGDPVRAAVGATVAAMVVVLVPLHGVFPYMVGLGLPQLFFALAGVALAGLPHATRLSPLAPAAPARRMPDDVAFG